jgi:hypothetical protein
MITFKNFISNLNFNHILFGFILFSFFYLKNLINKLTNLHCVNIIILNKLYNKIISISQKNKKNHNKFNKKLKKNYKKIKKIKKILKSNNFKNIESNKIIEVIPTTIINNIDPIHTNCITVDEENEFEILD